MNRWVFMLVALLTVAGRGAARAQGGVGGGTGWSCGFDGLMARDHGGVERREAIDRMLYGILSHRERSSPRLQAEDVYTIPVVVHIVHDGGDENISDARVIDGIAQLNRIYANTGIYDSSTGVSLGIQFCLARQDPAGAVTTGITRTRSPLTEIVLESQDLDVKSLIRWDPLHYLNIWLVREITSLWSGPDVAAYAYFPSSHGAPEDGIMAEARWFGSSDDDMKVIAHEAGHYLGLYHTFEGGCFNSDCLADGDRVCDTPPDAITTGVACGARVNSCASDADDRSTNNPFRPIADGGLGDQDDLYTDYMDYGRLECFTLFTQGQKDRMRAALVAVRGSLLESKGCLNPCATSVIASFSTSSGSVDVGTPVTFTNTSSGATTFEWRVDGVLVATTRDLTHTFLSKGSHTVELHVFNGDAACTQSETETITVRCPVHASFVVGRTAITPGESLTFTSTSTNGTTFEWLIEGVPVGTGEIFTRTFKDAGGYRIALVASNGECSDTSASVYIRVGTCAATGLWSFWYFGYNAGIDFNGGSPTVLTDGALNSDEGITSISDNNGRLLCYSDGTTVWNREHRVMMNGDGLGGSHISAQSALIVPWPGSDSLYYIFTTPDWEAPTSDLQYSIIDMSLDNGLGGVTSVKNVVLNGNVAEQVTAVPQRGCGNIWIVSHEKGNNHFLSYLITPAGLITTPAISAIGSITDGSNRFGGIKFSQNSGRLCSTLGGSQENPTIELFDFDAANGIIDNPRVLATRDELRNAYSSEFSPNGRFLYVTGLTDPNLYQYDLSNGNVNAIRASKSVVARAGGVFAGLQLGPDGRIYVVHRGEPILSAIEYPNLRANACGFIDNAINLAPGRAGLCLPNFPSGYIDRRLHVAGQTSVCVADSFAFYRAVSRGCLAVAGRWSVVGDAEIIASTDSTATLHLKSAGSALLIIEKDGDCGTLADTMSIAIERAPQVDLGPDTAVCAGSPFLLDAGGDYTSYLWQDGSRGRTLLARAPGVYWVEISLGQGCTARDTIAILPANDGLALHLGPDISLCNGGTYLLDAGPGATGYRWQDGSTGRTYTAYRPGVYWVEATGRCGIVADTIVINSAAPGIDLGPDTATCGDIYLTLDAGPGFESYEWQDGSTGRTYHAHEPGIYVVHGRLGGCESIGSISITKTGNGQAPHLGPDTSLCNGDTRLLDAGPGFDSYKWQDGSTARTYTAHGPGVYSVEATGPCGIVADTVVIDPAVPGIDLGPDISTCEDIDLTLDAGPGFDSYEWQDGSTGRIYHARAPGTYVVRGRLGGCESVGSVQIMMNGALTMTATLGTIRAITAAPGDEVRLPLLLGSSSDAGMAGQAFTVVVRVKRGLLMPTGDTPQGVVVGGDRVITLSGVIGRSDTVAVLRFLTLLGDSDRAAIVIDSFAVASDCIGAITRDSLEVAIQACQTGGPRLVGSGGAAALRVRLPVAPGGAATIDYVLAEDGATRLSLVNAVGERLRVLVNERLSAGSHGEHLRLRDLPAGLYFVLLETPTQALVEKFVVER